jgi:hypothetical protein
MPVHSPALRQSHRCERRPPFGQIALLQRPTSLDGLLTCDLAVHGRE